MAETGGGRMGVLIPDIEMPKSCRDCFMLNEAYYCVFTNATQSYSDKRHEKCPLQETEE